MAFFFGLAASVSFANTALFAFCTTHAHMPIVSRIERHEGEWGGRTWYATGSSTVSLRVFCSASSALRRSCRSWSSVRRWAGARSTFALYSTIHLFRRRVVTCQHMARAVTQEVHALLVPSSERGLIAVSGEVPLGKHFRYALLRVDVVGDLGQVLGLIVFFRSRSVNRSANHISRCCAKLETHRAFPLPRSLSLSLPLADALEPVPAEKSWSQRCFCLLLDESAAGPWPLVEPSARKRLQLLSRCGLILREGTCFWHTGQSTVSESHGSECVTRCPVNRACVHRPLRKRARASVSTMGSKFSPDNTYGSRSGRNIPGRVPEVDDSGLDGTRMTSSSEVVAGDWSRLRLLPVRSECDESCRECGGRMGCAFRATSSVASRRMSGLAVRIWFKDVEVKI